mmetsp:Transcript_90060/g.255038  ORF Transcript_90060/g.255038 Transcript_90060/m.255038 type:complete len:89 (-) Transcript_90060:185-451(-)
MRAILAIAWSFSMESSCTLVNMVSFEMRPPQCCDGGDCTFELHFPNFRHGVERSLAAQTGRTHILTGGTLRKMLQLVILENESCAFRY